MASIGISGPMQVFGRNRRLAAACSLLALSACVNPAFQEATAEFGSLTRQAAATQKQRLSAVVAAEQELIRNRLAQERTRLELTSDCAALLAADTAGSADPNRPDPICRIVKAGGEAIQEPPGFDNIVALTSAIERYAESLERLSGDFSDDRAAFSEAMTGLATSIGGVAKTARAVAGASPAEADPRLGAIATLAAEAGNLYFAHERQRMLRRTIIQSDPIVQEAVGLLETSQQRLQLYERAALAEGILEARAKANALAANPKASLSELRAAQNRLFDLVAIYNRHGADIRRFGAIGEAHAKLASAAQARASTAELRAAIEALIDLAGTAHETVIVIRSQETGGDP